MKSDRSIVSENADISLTDIILFEIKAKTVNQYTENGRKEQMWYKYIYNSLNKSIVKRYL